MGDKLKFFKPKEGEEVTITFLPWPGSSIFLPEHTEYISPYAHAKKFEDSCPICQMLKNENSCK